MYGYFRRVCVWVCVGVIVEYCVLYLYEWLNKLICKST